jgi:hypothetical protein
MREVVSIINADQGSASAAARDNGGSSGESPEVGNTSASTTGPMTAPVQEVESRDDDDRSNNSAPFFF